MTTYKINVAVDEKKCVACGKNKKGCYERKDGSYICNDCLIKASNK